MAVSDSAIGAILEIPTDVLNKITQADRQIQKLGKTSFDTASAIKTHWSQIAPSGLDVFIAKLAEAQAKMQGMGNISLNLNVGQAQQQMDNLTNTVQTNSEKVSKAVQDMSAIPLDFSNLSDSATILKAKINDLEAALIALKRAQGEGEVDSAALQAINNQIYALKQFIELQKQSDDERRKANQKQADTSILQEQKTLISQILQLQKDINAETLRQERTKKIGGAISPEDTARLEEYQNKITQLVEAYEKLKTKTVLMSEAGQNKFNASDADAELKTIREQVAAQDKLNQALQQTERLNSTTKLKSAGISSREEAVYQSELVAKYQQMIAIIRKKGDIEAQASAQARELTTAEKNHLQNLENEYRRLEELVARTTGKFAEIDRAQAKNFENAKTLQESENMAKLADAADKAAEKIAKKNEAERKSAKTDLSKDQAEYKRVLSLIEQLEKAWRRMNEAMASGTVGGDMAKRIENSMIAANYALENLYKRRDELEAKRGADLEQIAAQNEAKKGAVAVAEHEKAEKEKTRISKQEAQERYNEEMRQKRLENADLTAQSKRQRMSISNAKEDRESQLFAARQKEVERLRKEIELLDKTDANYAKNLDNLNRRINELLGSSSARVKYTKEEALNMAKNAKTLNDLQRAYTALKSAMADLDPKSQAWKDLNRELQQVKPKIDEIKKSMGDFQNQTRRSGDLMGQLGNRIAAAFSIGAITGFLRKMVEVRAQFELQRVALGAILQDTDRANQMFVQVQQMALQSPFSIMQLERATKQIAAFGFEADKIVPTLKMLADMSAGLGVEIDRLVLVMGHLKARNYLEGTMVRQFTNAGFNVLGELSKYYTELEGRMVSVAEVQDRVKKKMVEFADVEEVLKRVTSAGGMFYDMQKKQSESIWGQMQRIKDAYDLMLNEIGKNTQGTISYVLTSIRAIINHWRTLLPLIKTVGTVMGAVLAVKGVIALAYQLNKLGVIVQTLATSWRLVGLAANQAATSMKLAWASTGIGLLIAAVTTLTFYLLGAREEAKALSDELSRIGAENVNNLNNAIAQFAQLAKTISSDSKNYNERAEAMNEMKRVFGEILPMEKLEMDYIKGLNGNYTELIDTISKYYREKEYQQKYDAIIASNEAKAVQDEIERTLKRANENGDLGMLFSDEQIKAWSETLASELNSGKIHNSLGALKKRFLEIFPDSKYVDKYFKETFGKADFTDVIDKEDKVREKFGNIALATSQATNALEMYNEQLGRMDYDQLSGKAEKDKQRIEVIKSQIEETSKLLTVEHATDLQRAQAQNRINELNAELKRYSTRLSEVEEAQHKLIAQELADAVEKDAKSFTGLIQKYWELGIEMQDLEKHGKKNSDRYKDLASQQNEAKKSAVSLKDQYTEVNWALIDNAETTHELNVQLEDISTKAFPNVAKRAITMSDKISLAWFKAKKAGQSFMKWMVDLLPDEMKENLPDFAAMLGETEQQIADLEAKIAESAQSAVSKTDNSAIYSEISKRAVDKYGADMMRINTITKDGTKTAKDMAKELRNEAKTLKETTDAYAAASNKQSFLEANHLTEKDIEQYKKTADAANAIADELWGKEDKSKKGKGKDEITELWKNRLKAIQDFYKRYEELRKHFNEEESLKRATDAFAPLFQSLTMNMNDIVAKGMDKQGLANNLKEMTDAVRKVRPQLVDEFQKAFADTQIQVDFKLKEDAENKLKKELEDLFANYELTAEFKKLGLNVDLTYMLGGKPVTLDDIRAELKRLREEGGGNADAENRIKILEDAEKKLTRIELKEQKERLKNYEKYLKQMYSERAKKMIEAYSTYEQMERDFQKNIQQLEAEMNADGTSEARKKEIQGLIESLKSQAAEAALGIKNELQNAMAKANWESFKGSDIFVSMYQDLDTLSKKGIGELIKRLEAVRNQLQSMENVDPKAVREVTQYIEKLKGAKIDLAPYEGFRAAIKAAKDLKKEYGSLEKAQLKLIELNDSALGYEQEIADLETIIGLQDKKISIEGLDEETTQRLVALQAKYGDNVKDALANARKMLATTKSEAGTLQQRLDAANNTTKAYQAQINKMQKYREYVEQITNAIFDMADALGASVDDEWKALASSLIDATFQAITLTLQMQILQVQAQLLGVAMNSAMGIIGYIAIALQVVANLLVAIFAAHDKRLERQIERVQERVDSLTKSFERLEKAIEKAFTLRNENDLTNRAISNLENQKNAYREMIALEQKKKKTDDDKIKEYREKLEEIDDMMDELYEKRHEKWGSTNDVWDEANNWVDAWLDAYKETGDGLDALNESWDEFYANLVKKQAASAIVSRRMSSFINQINDAIDKGLDEYDMVDTYRELGEKFKSQFSSINEGLKKFFEYAGIQGGNGELILSDLQKGIQNITEPQAAAIEAYLNSMRFEVFRHTAQLDSLIQIISEQYDTGADNPVVAELKGIRMVLDRIDGNIQSVIENKSMRGATIKVS